MVIAVNLRADPARLSLALPPACEEPVTAWCKRAACRVAGQELQVDLDAYGFLAVEL